MLRYIMNVWPPFVGAGIFVESITPDWSAARVRMSLRFYNQNYMGTHFGGSLFGMTDPFLMLLTLHRLGSEFTVWDKAGSIDFRKPGRTRVYATIEIDQSFVDEIHAATSDGRAHFVTRDIEVLDKVGDIVAVVTKTLYVRRKRQRKPKTKAVQTIVDTTATPHRKEKSEPTTATNQISRESIPDPDTAVDETQQPGGPD